MDGSVEALDELRMEAEDLACSRIHQVSVHTCLDQAFLHAHVVVLLDELDQEEEEEQTLLRKTVERFQRYGQLMEAGAHKDVRVIVAGNSFVNLKVSVLLESAPSLDSSRFIGIATQLENEARAQIAQKLQVKSAGNRFSLLFLFVMKLRLNSWFFHLPSYLCKTNWYSQVVKTLHQFSREVTNACNIFSASKRTMPSFILCSWGKNPFMKTGIRKRIASCVNIQYELLIIHSLT